MLAELDYLKREDQEIKEARKSLYKFRNSYSNSQIQKNNDNFEKENSLLSKGRKKNLSYIEFKKKFAKCLEEKEKDNKDLKNYLNLNEDYLVSLYKDVFVNNPDQDFIFKNPVLILNYIFTELNNKNDKIKEEAKELIQLQELNSQRNSKKSKTQKTFSFFQKSSFHQSYKKIIEKNISSISDNESDSENSINSNDKRLNNENIDNL